MFGRGRTLFATGVLFVAIGTGTAIAEETPDPWAPLAEGITVGEPLSCNDAELGQFCIYYCWKGDIRQPCGARKPEGVDLPLPPECRQAAAAELCLLYCPVAGLIAVICGVEHLPVVEEGPGNEASGWVYYANNEYALLNPTVSYVQGSKLPDASCDFSGDLDLPEDKWAIELRETGFNPVTCQMRIEVGFPPSGAIPEDPPIESLISEEEPWTALVNTSDVWPPDPVAPPPPPDACTSKFTEGLCLYESSAEASSSMATASGTRKRKAGYFHTAFEDPVDLDVNWNRSYIDWVYDGTCVRGPTYHKSKRHWLSESGWRKVSSDRNDYKTCSVAHTATYAHFKNPYFCRGVTLGFGGPTHTYYDRTRVMGFGYGKLRGRWHSRKGGDCTFLLHTEDRLVRTR
jgi:hypothetical protein